MAVYERLPRPGVGGGEAHFVVLDYLCEATGGLLAAGDDADDAAWFSVSDLADMHLTPGATEVIRKGFRMVACQSD